MKKPTTMPLFSLPQDKSIEARFLEFHNANPDVYALIVRFAREVKRAGKDKYGIDAIFNRIRWHYQIELATEEPFKMNDHFRSRYARLIMQRESDLEGFFETRTLRSA